MDEAAFNMERAQGFKRQLLAHVEELIDAALERGVRVHALIKMPQHPALEAIAAEALRRSGMELTQHIDPNAEFRFDITITTTDPFEVKGRTIEWKLN